MVHNTNNIIPHTEIRTGLDLSETSRGHHTLISANRNAGIFREKGFIGGVRTGVLYSSTESVLCLSIIVIIVAIWSGVSVHRESISTESRLDIQTE